MGIKSVIGELTGIKNISNESSNNNNNNVNYGSNSSFFNTQNNGSNFNQNYGNIPSSNLSNQNQYFNNQINNMQNSGFNNQNLQNFNQGNLNQNQNFSNIPLNNNDQVMSYQQNLINQKNGFSRNAVNQNVQTNFVNNQQNHYSQPNFSNNQQNQNSYSNFGYDQNINYNNQQTSFNYDGYQNFDILNQNLDNQVYQNQGLIMPRPNNYNNSININQQSRRRQRIAPLEYDNGRFAQNHIDFDLPHPIDYGNYQEPNELEKMNDINYLNERYLRSNSRYDNGFYNQNNLENIPSNIDYNQFNNFNSYNDSGYENNNFHDQLPQPKKFYNSAEDYKISSVIPNQIAKEVRSEKLRVSFLMLFGFAGIVASSIMIAGYFYLVKLTDVQRETTTFAGLKFQAMFRPLFSISMLLGSLLIFSLGATDYSLLISNIKKYERDLSLGNEQIPYFIIRNCKNLISRGVYVTWISFTIYILGAISLGILYGFQSLYDSGHKDMYFLFWKVTTLKSFKSEISMNIIFLIATLLTHIINIVSSRARKNNIISYYGQSIFSDEEERRIKKQANKICIILWSVVIAIILFAIIIPWLIIRKKNKKSLWPFGKNNN